MAIFCFSNENTPASKNVKKLMTIFNDFFEETKNSRNSYQLRIERSSRSQMFFKIGVLGVLDVLDLKACKFIKKRLQHRCFPVKFAIFLENVFLRNTSGGCFWIDLDFLVLHKHLLRFGNSYIYVCWINNGPVTRTIGMKFNFLERQVLETHYKYLIC